MIILLKDMLLAPRVSLSRRDFSEAARRRFRRGTSYHTLQPACEAVMTEGPPARLAGEFDCAAAVGRVRAIDDRAPALRGAAEVRAVECATVGERDALAALESAVERAGRDAEFPRLLNVEGAWAILLRHAEAEGGQ